MLTAEVKIPANIVRVLNDPNFPRECVVNLSLAELETLSQNVGEALSLLVERPAPQAQPDDATFDLDDAETVEDEFDKIKGDMELFVNGKKATKLEFLTALDKMFK